MYPVPFHRTSLSTYHTYSASLPAGRLAQRATQSAVASKPSGPRTQNSFVFSIGKSSDPSTPEEIA